jgi:hypothetical protein
MDVIGTVPPHLVLIAEIGPQVGMTPAALFSAGCAGEIALVRVGQRWACERGDAETLAAKRRAAASATTAGPSTA